MNLVLLIREMSNHFNLEEIRVLCFELNINYDDLPGEVRSAKIRELVLYLERRGMIPELLDVLTRYRPTIDWDSFVNSKESDINAKQESIVGLFGEAFNNLPPLLVYGGLLLIVAVVIFFILIQETPSNFLWVIIPVVVIPVFLLIILFRFDFLNAISSIRSPVQEFYSQRRNERYQIDKLQEINNLKDLSEIKPESFEATLFSSRIAQRTLIDIRKELSDSLSASSNYNKLASLNRAQNLISELQVILQNEPKRKVRKFDKLLKSWLQLIKEETQTLVVHQTKIEEIPNPFIPGQPIQSDSKTVFRGRQDIFKELQNSLSSLYQPPTIVLYGARRSGKTSLLNQLPHQLSQDIVPVFINLQEAAGTAMGATGFVSYLVENIQKQSKVNREVFIPDIDKNDVFDEPYLAFSRWLRKCKHALKKLTLFITFDEYEWVDQAIEKDRLGEEVLSFFRNLIQQSELRLILLFAGVHKLSELKYNWPSYFINVKTIKISYLPEADARRLITNPTPDFPLNYDPDALDFFIQQTRCQPYLIQLIAFEMIIYLNSPERRSQGDWSTANIADIEVGLSRSLEAGNNYFAEIWQDCNPNERLILADLAARKKFPPELNEREQVLGINRLFRKDLIEEIAGRYHYQVPLIARWVRENKPPQLVRAEIS